MLNIESQFSERVDSGYLAGKAPVTSHLKYILLYDYRQSNGVFSLYASIYFYKVYVQYQRLTLLTSILQSIVILSLQCYNSLPKGGVWHDVTCP